MIQSRRINIPFRLRRPTAVDAVVAVVFTSISMAAIAQQPAVTPAVATPPAAALTPDSPAGKAEHLYSIAIDSLRRGKEFENCASQLRSAIALKDDWRFHVALGSAYVSRVASLVDASCRERRYQGNLQKYQRKLADWETARKQDANAPKPDPPPVLCTQDDKQPFTLTPDQVKQRFIALSGLADAEWNAAAKLAGSPFERGATQHYHGWGLAVLRMFGSQVGRDVMPDREAIIDAFEKATREEPRRAIYWQSLGDAKSDLPTMIQEMPDVPGAAAAYKQAESLGKPDANIWYRVYQLCRKPQPDEALYALRQAALADASNAYVSYQLAAVLLDATSFGNAKQPPRSRGSVEETKAAAATRIMALPSLADDEAAAHEALAFVDRGNHAPEYTYPFYAPGLPDLLKSAWSLGLNSLYYHDVDGWRYWDISDGAGRYIRAVMLQGKTGEAVDAANAVAGMGYRVCSDVIHNPLPMSSVNIITIQYGLGTVSHAYHDLGDAYESVGDADDAGRARARGEAAIDQALDMNRQNLRAWETTYGNGED